jgi:2-polyprenyl-6-methoxyphenol hydroxylase-like FAD-dependent oxidoreductase
MHQLSHFLQDRAPWFQSQIEEIVWTADVQFEPRLARQFGLNLCWLAGDAAHQTGPVGMQSMNIGFLEAADLADALIRILRKGGSPDLLKDYDRAHRGEWSQLLGFKPGAAYPDTGAGWAQRRAARIVASIPASGAELTSLLKQVGIDSQFATQQSSRPA